MLVLTTMLTCSLVVVVLMQWRFIATIREQLHYQEERDRVGDLGLERELRQVYRRLAGLLASPRTYLRARRMLAPLDLDLDEITAELELIEVTT